MRKHWFWRLLRSLVGDLDDLVEPFGTLMTSKISILSTFGQLSGSPWAFGIDLGTSSGHLGFILRQSGGYLAQFVICEYTNLGEFVY